MNNSSSIPSSQDSCNCNFQSIENSSLLPDKCVRCKKHLSGECVFTIDMRSHCKNEDDLLHPDIAQLFKDEYEELKRLRQQASQGASNYKLLTVGIDTLCIGFYLRGFKVNYSYCDLQTKQVIQSGDSSSVMGSSDVSFLESMKVQGRSRIFDTSGQQVRFKNKEFALMPKGLRTYTYILINSDITVKIAPRAMGLFPEVYVEFRSGFLWRMGYRNAYRLVVDWLNEWVEIDREVISRVDVCKDVAVAKEFDLTTDNIVGRPRKNRNLNEPEIDGFSSFFNCGALDGVHIGGFIGPNLICRIYNKSQEIKESCKDWFKALWTVFGWNRSDVVWRVEFEMKRKFLKEFQIHSFKDLESQLSDVWRYLTFDWVQIKEINKEDSNRTRWKTMAFWELIQEKLRGFGEITGVIRVDQKQGKVKKLVDMCGGVLSSIGALTGETDLDNVIQGFKEIFHDRMDKRGTTFERKVEKKVGRYRQFDECEIKT